MFRLFQQTRLKPSVTSEDKKWIEDNFAWFIELFGLEKLRTRPFLLPTLTDFPYDNFNDPEQFKRLFIQLCAHWELQPNEIGIKIFDDIKSKEWTTWSPEGYVTQPGAFFYQTHLTGDKRYIIEIARSNFKNGQALIAVLAYGLSYIKFLRYKLADNMHGLENVRDLAAIYLGFGIYIANTSVMQEVSWIGRQGSLPPQVISYANALLCYLTDTKAEHVINYLNSNTRKLFNNDFRFLSKTNNTLLTRPAITRLENSYQLFSKLMKGFDEKNFDIAIEACNDLLAINNKNSVAYNNLGYALLQQKKYPEAIVQFTKAVSLDPYFDYAYNNRGYCKLQLGDVENAFADLHHSFEMNPDNAFSWRNMGAFYLATGENEKALEHFQQAQSIDPNCEMIHFYLGHCNSRLGNIEIANHHFSMSKEMNEHNDSSLPGEN